MNKSDIDLQITVMDVANKLFASKSLEELQTLAKNMEQNIISLGGKCDDIRQYNDNMDKSELSYLLVLLGMKRDLCKNGIL